MPQSYVVLEKLLVAGLLVSAMLAVGLLPFLAVGDRSESGAVAAGGAIAVLALHGNMVVSVGFDSSRRFGSRCRGKRAQTHDSGSRAGYDCERKNELLHFLIP